MAAPALAASMADCAICSGVTGTAGLRPGVSAEPVTAHEIMTFRCMPLPPCALTFVAAKRSARTGPKPRGSHAQHGTQPPHSKLLTGWLRAARAAREASSDQPPACLPLCTALSLLARPSLERIRSVAEGDFASAYGTLAAGGLSVRGRNVGGQLADE